MATNQTRPQIPLNSKVIDANGRMLNPWVQFLVVLLSQMPPPNQNFVGTGSGNSLHYDIGLDADKPTAALGSIYFATDTGNIYTVDPYALTWEKQIPSYTGDLSNSVGSNVLELNRVNPDPGTFGSSTEIPVLTVNEKGLITSMSFMTDSSVSPGKPMI